MSRSVAPSNSLPRKSSARSTRSARKQMMQPFHNASWLAKRNWKRFASKSKTLSKQFRRYGILFVISAPSGAGKTTLVAALRQTPDLVYSVSCTTRAPRAVEIDREDYQFLSDAEFRARVKSADFLEYAQVHGDFYGTLREPVITNLQNGVAVLLDIATSGAASIRNPYDPFIPHALPDVFNLRPQFQEFSLRLTPPRSRTGQ